jgi:predicted ArsR family transcriptional regulator
MNSPESKSPARQILEYLETHENLTAKEACELCQLGMDNYARRILQELEQRGLVRRDVKAHKGGQRFTKGRYFAQWREWEANGFQTGALTHDQFEIPGLLKPLMPGMK